LKQVDGALARIEEVELEDVNPAFVAQLRDLHKFLKAQSHVLSLLREACESNDLELLKAAKGQVGKLDGDFPTHQLSEQVENAKGRVDVLITELENLHRLKDDLKSATLQEDIKSLAALVLEAKAHAELVTCEEFIEAAKVLETLQKEQQVVQDFTKCFSELDRMEKVDFSHIEMLEAVTDKLKTFCSDSMRKDKVCKAEEFIMRALASMMEQAEKNEDCKMLEEQLIPKAGAMGFSRLEIQGLEWLEKHRKERERQRQEQKAQEEQESKTKQDDEQQQQEQLKKPIAAATGTTSEEQQKKDKSSKQVQEQTDAGTKEGQTQTDKAVSATVPDTSSGVETKGLRLFPRGTLVVVVGLSVNSEFNGRIAEVDDFDTDHGRFVIRLQEQNPAQQKNILTSSKPTDKLLGVRRANIKQLDAARQRVLERKKALEAKKKNAKLAVRDDLGLESENVQIPDELSEKLRQAAEKSDKRRLTEILANPKLANARGHKDVRLAASVLQAILNEEEAEVKLSESIKSVKTTNIKLWLHKISELDKAAQRRLKPLVERGRHIAYLMTKQELLVLKLRKALQDLNKSKLRFLIKFANTPWLRSQPEVIQAESFLQANPDKSPTSASSGGSATAKSPNLLQKQQHQSSLDVKKKGLSPRRSRSSPKVPEKSPLSVQLEKALHSYQSKRGLHPLGSLECLRTEAQYLKKIFFSRKFHRENRLVHQSVPLPHSVTKLTDASHDVKQRAKHMFKNLLFYTGEVYHAYPVTLGYAVLQQAIQEPQLRPEIYCQLVKQTTQCKSEFSLLRTWKLMLLCMHAFEPEGEVKKCILSHAAKHADFKVDLSEANHRVRLRVLENVETIATLMLILEFQRPLTPYSASLDEVKAVTDAHLLPESLEPPVMKVFMRKDKDRDHDA